MTTFTSKIGVDDLTLLTTISNDEINGTLSKRYAKDIIYTWIGSVLISVNPFKLIATLTDTNALEQYRNHYQYENPPHVFALADDMYRNMLADQENHCVIISGESGAGKTEASKLIMQFIAHNCGRSIEVTRVRDIILDSNPLLEAFGNAKTVRNNNSSRFGKYMEIQFDRGGDPRGGRITNYLLEKSRVVYQQKDERNFHVFYLLLAGADSSMRETLCLQDASYYHYLNQSGCTKVDGMNDAEEYKDVNRAMDTMGFTAEEKSEIWRILSAILYLGNVQFADDDKEQAYVVNEDCVEMFAYLIQSDAESVRRSILFRTISTGTQGRSARVSTYGVPQNALGATYSRDALAKATYSRLFDFIIARVNEVLTWNDRESLTVLGILDIYGFEIFDNNGFEQLCINYVNEKLQQIFINLTLKEEQEEYDREQIPWEPIQFFNNKICCDLIESKKNPIGILTLLDDTCNFPQGTDDKFLEKLSQHHMQHAHFAGGSKNLSFTIKHYAGDVEYVCDGMCDKNKDALYNDLINLAQCTSMTLLPKLFPESATSDDKRRPTTAGFKIRESIQALVAALSQCHPHYIRCIKPNDKKAANTFVNDRVLHQVKYLGLLENVKVRRAGYAYRQLYDKFFFRYAIINDATWPPEKYNGRFKEGAMLILQGLNLTPDGKKQPYAAGSTKIFIRAPETLFTLEEMRERKTFTYANRIQKFFLKHANDYYIWTLKKSSNDALKGKKDRRRLSLERNYDGDYISYKENFQLKAIAGRDVKAHFADVCEYIVKGKKERRICVLTGFNVHIIALDKNKDKNTKKTKPYVYMESVRIGLGPLTGLTMSTMADGYVAFHQQGLPDEMIELNKKTEFLAYLLKFKNNLPITFSDTISLMDRKQKATKFTFLQLPSAPEGGIYKSKKISVPPGSGKDAYPNISEPPKPTHEKTSYAPQERGTAPAGRPAPGGPPKAAAKAPAPGGPKKFPGPAKMAAPEPEEAPEDAPLPPPGPRPGPPGPKKAMPGPGGPKKMGPGPGAAGPGPAPGGLKKMAPGPGGPKKMGPGPGGPGPAPGGPKKMAPPPAGGAGRPTPPGM